MSVRSTQDAGPDIDSNLGGKRGREEEKGRADDYLMLYINFSSKAAEGLSSAGVFRNPCEPSSGASAAADEPFPSSRFD